MSTACINALPQQLQNWSIEKYDDGSQKLSRNSINSNILNSVEENRDLTLTSSEALSSPALPQLWYTHEYFIPYCFTPPTPQYSPIMPYLSYYSNTVKHRDKKKRNFCCGGIAQPLWTIVTIIALGLLAILILALLIL